MALSSNAAMLLFYAIDGDAAAHDAWHTYEHLHERLSIPGFLRATRWVELGQSASYFVLYEVADPSVGSSAAYLDRLNQPTPWTRSLMQRFRGMTRGFATVSASTGFGLGQVCMTLRFHPTDGEDDGVAKRIADRLIPTLTAIPGMSGVHLFRPEPPPPMTAEQAIRGADKALPWVLLASAYDASAIDSATRELEDRRLVDIGIATGGERNRYVLHYTATALEVARSAPMLPPRVPSD